MGSNDLNLNSDEKLARQTDLVNMMVHDLKGPLMEIIANLDIVLSNESIQGVDKECLATAMEGCQNMMEAVQDMLDLGKMESGMLQPKLEKVDLAQIVEGRLKAINGTLLEKEMKAVFDNKTPILVKADPKLLNRMIANLFSNALKFSPPSSTLRVFTGKNGNMARFTVKDMGPGVPPEYREHIFGKYAQVEMRTHRVAGGTGLGLTFCKMAAEAHHGTIGLEDDGTTGAKFFFEIPLDG
jgi:signal transduction histidine kinase